MSERPLTYAHPAFAGLIGVAREDITPPVGIYARNWGAAKHDVAEGIHQPLTVTALTLQQRVDDSPLVLIAVDLGWWRTAEDERYLRDYVLDTLSLDDARLIIALSHTHSGPCICREDSDKPGGALVGPYMERLRVAIARAAQRARDSAKPAVMEWTYGRCGLAHNRDLPDPGSERIACGFNPSRGADDTLLIGRVTVDDENVATVVNYACHPVTLAWENRLISPDFVGGLRKLVEAHPPDALCLFLQGASGELAPRDEYSGLPAMADVNGRQLAFSTLAALESMLPPRTRMEFALLVESGADLATWRYEPSEPSAALAARRLELEVPLKDWPTASEIEHQLSATADRVLAERLIRKLRVRRAVGDGPTYRLPVWLWRVGDAILIGSPNEAYSLLQTELRRRFPSRAISVMNCVNGPYCGYLPPAELYDQNVYQVWQTPFERGCLERLIEACASAVQEEIDGR